MKTNKTDGILKKLKDDNWRLRRFRINDLDILASYWIGKISGLSYEDNVNSIANRASRMAFKPNPIPLETMAELKATAVFKSSRMEADLEAKDFVDSLIEKRWSKKFSQKKIFLFLMHHYYGFNLDEVCFSAKLSKSRVCAIFAEMRENAIKWGEW